MRALFLVEGDPDTGMSPAARYRAYQFKPYLETAGIEVTYSPSRPAKYYSQRSWHREFSNRSRAFERFSYTVGPRLMLLGRLWDVLRSHWYDVVVIQRELVPGAAPTPERWFAGRLPIVFDIDDAIYLQGGPEGGGSTGDSIGKVMELSDVVTAGSEALVEYAESRNRHVEYLPTTIETSLYEPTGEDPSGSPVVLWTGTSSNLVQLESKAEALTRVAQMQNFRLRVICDQPPRLPASLEVEYRPWSLTRESEDFRGAAVGLMPLEDNPWNRAKCGLKLLIYGALGLPSIASPVGANENIILDGETGFLARNQDEWAAALLTLLRDRSLRSNMGRRARDRIVESWSTRAWAQHFVRILNEAGSRG